MVAGRQDLQLVSAWAVVVWAAVGVQVAGLAVALDSLESKDSEKLVEGRQPVVWAVVVWAD